MDIMNIDPIQFLITTSRDIQFTTVDGLERKDKQSLMSSVQRLVNLYKKRGFIIQTCLADNKFESLRSSLLNLGIYARQVNIFQKWKGKFEL
jgi:hypothetical protein